MQQQQQQEMTLGEQIGVVVGFCQIISFPLLIFLRRPGTWGSRMVNHQAVMGVFAAPLIIGSSDPSSASYFFWASLALLVFHRLSGFWTPKGTHSRYNGFPWLCRKNEMRCKGLTEPLVVLLLGVTALSFSKGLGTYLLAGGVALVVSFAWQAARIRCQVRSINDSRLEQLYVRSVYQEEVDGV